MSDSVRPHRRQPTRLPCPWDSPGKNTGVDCYFLLQFMKGKSENEVAQSCPTLSNPMYCSLPGSSVHGIFQARVLAWGAIAFSNPYVCIHEYLCTYIMCITNEYICTFFYLSIASNNKEKPLSLQLLTGTFSCSKLPSFPGFLISRKQALLFCFHLFFHLSP